MSSNGSLAELAGGSGQGPPPEREASGGSEVEVQRKVVVLGIPWQTEDATLHAHFAQHGAVEEAQIMREKYTGKSRGFGFVTFASAADAYRAVTTEHHIDGRKCEAKFALPEGKFGVVQDAYMPKDPSKQGHRGIGFVTYATPEAVEHVMQATHVLNGNEIAIDRAAPKDRGSSLLPGRTFMSQPNLQLASGVAGGGSSHGGGSHHAHYAVGGGGGSGSAHGGLFGGRRGAGAYGGLPASPPPFGEGGVLGSGIGSMGSRRLSHPALGGGSPQQHDLAAAAAGGGGGFHPTLGTVSSPYGSGMSLNLLAQAQAQAAALQQQISGSRLAGLEGSSPSGQLLSLLGTSASNNGGLGQYGAAAAAAAHQLRASGSLSAGSSHNDLAGLLAQHLPPTSGGASAGGSVRGGGGGGALGPPSARAGPRIFVGKLNKETMEQDVKEYFSRFGFVMDVYLPRGKNNKREHRGFGFVTFETEAAIQRVVTHAPHYIKGSIVAIDSAVPRQEEMILAVDPAAAAAAVLQGGAQQLDEGAVRASMDLLSLDGSNHSHRGGGMLPGAPF
eukprot:scaffold6.g2740.t1